MIKVSDYIANYFLRHGIDTCFGVTGGGAMHLNDSFGQHPEYKNIYNHHEQASAMAAEGYARQRGIPAIVSVTSGPGATNAITGVYGAWADSIPMIVLSGQMKRETLLTSTPVDLRYLGFQEGNIIEMVKGITKYSAVITDVRYLKYHLDRALSAAVTGRKGPVWLDIPIDVQGLKISADQQIGNLDLPDLNLINNMNGANLKVSEVIRELRASTKPILMIGEEVRWSDNYTAVRRLYEKLGIPVVTEWNAHDLIPCGHRLNSGRPGTIGTRGGNFSVQDADLVISLGCQLSIRQLSYEWKNFAKNAKIIAINSDYNELEKPTINIDIPIVSNCGDFSNELYTALQTETFDFSEWLNWCKKINQKYPVVQAKHYNEEKPLNVYAVINELTLSALTDTTFVLSNGAACVVGLQAANIKENTRIFTNSGASSMGYGVAASIGVAVASDKNRSVICIEGDGSIMMNLQELQTISTNNLNIKIIILNNEGYHSIRQTQNNIFDAKTRGYCGADLTSGLGFPNFETLSGAFGLEYISISSVKELKNSIEMIVKKTGSIVAEFFVDPNQDFEPKLITKVLEDGGFLTPSLEDMHPFLSKEELKNNQFKK